MSDKPRTGRAKAQPVALFITGLAFIGIGASEFPSFLGVGVVFMIIGMRGLQYQRAMKVKLEARSRKPE